MTFLSVFIEGLGAEPSFGPEDEAPRPARVRESDSPTQRLSEASFAPETAAALGFGH